MIKKLPVNAAAKQAAWRENIYILLYYAILTKILRSAIGLRKHPHHMARMMISTYLGVKPH